MINKEKSGGDGIKGDEEVSFGRGEGQFFLRLQSSQ